MSKELKKATFREIRVARAKEPRKMKKIASGIILVLLISMLLLSGSSHSTESTSFAGVEKAINFLIHKQFNQSVGLCRESPNFAPNVYWLVSDNLWVWKALKVANETYYFGAGDVGRVADEIEAKLKEDATLYNLPRDRNGFPISFMHEAVIGDVIPTPNRTSTILTLHSDDYIVKTEICNGTTMPDWYEYADRLLYKALSCHWEGNDTAANLYFKNATESERARWDGIGISDIATKADGLYATYKLALLLYTSKVLGRKLPFECELVKRMWSLQRESDGGIITNYYANGTLVGDANTETTSIVIIAVLTPPRARLGTFAFYYPWYGTPAVSGEWRHWSEGNSSGQIPHDPNTILPDGRRDIAAEDYSLLGPYDSNNESVIEQHVEWAKEANITCFIVSWWGQGSFEDKALFNISKVCEKEKFNFTVYIENSSSISQTVDDLTYLLNKYNDCSSWYRVDGRPVIFVYSRARNNLDPQAWLWHACTDSIGIDTNPNKTENAATQWLPAEKVRKPPRLGIIPFQPFKTTPGYIVTAKPIHLEPNENYSVNFCISDIRNDSPVWSDVGMRIKIGLDRNCTDTATTLYDHIVNFTDGWITKSIFINMTRYAGKDIYLRAESYDGGQRNWESEWAAADYLFINNSMGEIVSPDPFFDSGWTEVVHQMRERGANPYVIMDFGGFEERIDSFLDYFQDCVDGIHNYGVGVEDVSQVLDIYNIASESAHLRNVTFVATVVPGFNNTAVQTESHVIDRRDGSYYSLYWLIAKACSPDGYAITSFNEWHEGTEIEPSREYGCQYIYLTRRETIPEFSSIIILPLFMIATLLAVIVYEGKDHKWRMKTK